MIETGRDQPILIAMSRRNEICTMNVYGLTEKPKGQEKTSWFLSLLYYTIRSALSKLDVVFTQLLKWRAGNWEDWVQKISVPQSHGQIDMCAMSKV